jgi:hypothetical protein
VDWANFIRELVDQH